MKTKSVWVWAVSVVLGVSVSAVASEMSEASDAELLSEVSSRLGTAIAAQEIANVSYVCNDATLNIISIGSAGVFTAAVNARFRVLCETLQENLNAHRYSIRSPRQIAVCDDKSSLQIVPLFPSGRIGAIQKVELRAHVYCEIAQEQINGFK